MYLHSSKARTRANVYRATARVTKHFAAREAQLGLIPRLCSPFATAAASVRDFADFMATIVAKRLVEHLDRCGA